MADLEWAENIFRSLRTWDVARLFFSALLSKYHILQWDLHSWAILVSCLLHMLGFLPWFFFLENSCVIGLCLMVIFPGSIYDQPNQLLITMPQFSFNCHHSFSYYPQNILSSVFRAHQWALYALAIQNWLIWSNHFRNCLNALLCIKHINACTSEQNHKTLAFRQLWLKKSKAEKHRAKYLIYIVPQMGEKITTEQGEGED